MNPLLIFILAILSPVIMATSLLVPPYAGIVGASYIIYDKPGAVNPLHDKLFDIFYMIDVYTKLFSTWSHNIAETSILHYALPLLAMPIAGIMISIWLTGKVAHKLKDIFQLGASI